MLDPADASSVETARLQSRKRKNQVEVNVSRDSEKNFSLPSPSSSRKSHMKTELSTPTIKSVNNNDGDGVAQADSRQAAIEKEQYFLIRPSTDKRAKQTYFDGPAWFDLPSTPPISSTNTNLNLPFLSDTKKKYKSEKSDLRVDSYLSNVNSDSFSPSSPPWFKSTKDTEWMILQSQINLIGDHMSRFDSHTSEETPVKSTMSKDKAKLKEQTSLEGSMNEEDGPEDPRKAWARSKKMEKKLRERLKYGLGVTSSKYISSDEYQLPHIYPIKDAKLGAINAQVSALTRNWAKIRHLFDMAGGILLPSQLLKGLIRVGLTSPNATRVVEKLSAERKSNHDFISYRDIEAVYLDEPYETDSDKEFELSSGDEEELFEDPKKLLIKEANIATNVESVADTSTITKESMVEESLSFRHLESKEQGPYKGDYLESLEIVSGEFLEAKLNVETKEEMVNLSVDNSLRDLPNERETAVSFVQEGNASTEQASNPETLNQNNQVQVVNASKKEIKSDRATEADVKGLNGTENVSTKDADLHDRENALLLQGSQLSSGKHKPFIISRKKQSSSKGKSKHQRRVIRHRKRLLASILVRGILENEVQVMDNLIKLGHSVKYLKELDRRWIDQKEVGMSLLDITQVFNEDKRSGSTKIELQSFARLERFNPLSKGESSLESTIDIFRNMAASTIQTAMRGFFGRLRSRRVMCKYLVKMHVGHKMQLIQKRFFDWFARLKYTRIKLKRIFHCWKNHTNHLLYLRKVFRCCFWPYHVWRRETQFQIIARGKAKFLSNVWITYRKLNLIRAWKSRLEENKKIKGRALEKIGNKENSQKREILKIWKQYTIQSLRIKENWKKKGNHLFQTSREFKTKKIFLIWKLFACGSRLCERRSLQQYKHIQVVAGFLKVKSLRVEEFECFPPLAQLVGECNLQTLGKAAYLKGIYENVYSDLVKYDREKAIEKLVHFTTRCQKTFSYWKLYVQYNQKERYSWYHFAFKRQKKIWREWKKYIKKKKKGQIVESEDELQVTSIDREEEISPVEQDIEENSAEKRKRRLEEQKKKREAEIRRMKEEWENDKRWRIQGIKVAKSESQSLRRKRLQNTTMVSVLSNRIEVTEQDYKVINDETALLLKDQREVSNVKMQVQLQKGTDLQNIRGRLLHDVLCKVIEEVEEINMGLLVSICFRRMRYPIIARRSYSMMNKKKMKNWINICTRLRKLSNSMPRYKIIRDKWFIFNKWIRHMDQVYLFESPDLRSEVNRRRELLQKYSGDLSGPDVNEDKFACTVEGTFLRWIEYTQKRRVRKKLIVLNQKKMNQYTLSRIFSVLRTSTRPRYTYESRIRNVPFTTRRIQADMRKWKHRFINLEQQLISERCRKRNRFFAKRLRELTRNSDLLGVEMKRREKENQDRLNAESKLLCSAFEERGMFEFEDRLCTPVGKQDASKVKLGRFADINLPSYNSISCITVYISEGMVAGMELTYSTPGKSDFLSGVRGGKTEESHIFILSNSTGEKITSIEGIIGRSLGRIRFTTSLGRRSPWFGRGKQGNKFLLDTDPGDEFIIGFHGVATALSITNIGIICRKVTERTVFSNCWQNRPDRITGPEEANVETDSNRDAYIMEVETAHQRQLGTVLRMRTADVLNAQERAENFARRMKYSEKTPGPLRALTFILGLSRWYFEAINNRLIKLETEECEEEKTSDDNDVVLAKGYMTIRKGTKLVRKGNRALRQVEKLACDPVNNIPFNEAEISRNRVKELNDRKLESEKMVAEGKTILQAGKVMVQSGKANIPELDCSKRQQTYYEHLVNLAVVQDSLRENL